MGTIGTLPGDRLAGLLIDLIEKIRKGAITLDELALFTQRKNPFEAKNVAAHSSDSGMFPISVDYSQSLADMIKAGKYDWTNSEMTEKKFPLKGDGVVERTLMLCHFDRMMTSEQVIEANQVGGVEPATIEDLLAFGAMYPEAQRKYPIIALGSSALVRGGRFVPCLGGCGS